MQLLSSKRSIKYAQPVDWEWKWCSAIRTAADGEEGSEEADTRVLDVGWASAVGCRAPPLS